MSDAASNGPPADDVSLDASDNAGKPQDDPVPPHPDHEPKVSEGAPSETQAPDDDVDGGDLGGWTLEQLDAVVEERDQFRDAYQRAQAEFENYRKQSQKRIADEVARTQGAFVERLLPVLDAIDAARAQGSEHVEAVAGQLYGFLEKEGLERVDPHGDDFDPNVAEAVVHEPGEEERDQPLVTEVLRTGYLWNGRVIRPAMVKVAG